MRLIKQYFNLLCSIAYRFVGCIIRKLGNEFIGYYCYIVACNYFQSTYAFKFVEEMFSLHRRTHFDIQGELKIWKSVFLSRNKVSLLTETKRDMENKMFT